MASRRFSMGRADQARARAVTTSVRKASPEIAVMLVGLVLGAALLAAGPQPALYERFREEISLQLTGTQVLAPSANGEWFRYQAGTLSRKTSDVQPNNRARESQ